MEKTTKETAGGIMSRREIRERIFKLLFRVEFYETGEMEEQKELFLDDAEDFPEEACEKDKQEITEKFDAIADKLVQIDKMIDERATGWSTKRMGKVDLAIIRLAVYEICFDEQVPTGVAINEAVELAKSYGQDNSAAFVNGVLAKFAKTEEKRCTTGETAVLETADKPE